MAPTGSRERKKGSKDRQKKQQDDQGKHVYHAFYLLPFVDAACVSRHFFKQPFLSIFNQKTLMFLMDIMDLKKNGEKKNYILHEPRL